jgi:hypothetical protein
VASAIELRLPTYHALHVCKSSLAGDPIIDPIGFTSTSEGRHSGLNRQPDANKPRSNLPSADGGVGLSCPGARTARQRPWPGFWH